MRGVEPECVDLTGQCIYVVDRRVRTLCHLLLSPFYLVEVFGLCSDTHIRQSH